MDIKSSEKYPILFFEKFITEINLRNEFNKFESEVLENYQVLSYDNNILEIYSDGFHIIDLNIEFANHILTLLYKEFENSKEIIDTIAIDKLDTENKNSNIFKQKMELSIVNKIYLITESQIEILTKYPILKIPLKSIIHYINKQYSIYLKNEFVLPPLLSFVNIVLNFQSNNELIELVFGNLKNKTVSGIRIINETDYNYFKNSIIAFLENRNFESKKVLFNVMNKTQLNYLLGIIYKHNKHKIKAHHIIDFASRVIENYSDHKSLNYLGKHLTTKPEKIDNTIFSPYVIDFHRKN